MIVSFIRLSTPGPRLLSERVGQAISPDLMAITMRRA